MITTPTFTYSLAGLFNECSLMTAYMAKNVSLANGNMDDYCMSSDEEDVFMVCLNNAMPDIYESIIKLVHGESSTWSVGTLPSGNISITLDNNGAFNESVPELVNASLKKCIKYGVLKEFYTICLHSELYKAVTDNLMAELFKLKQRLFQLKKHSIASTDVNGGSGSH